MPVKCCALVKLQGVKEAIDGKVKYATHILLYITQRVGSYDSHFAFGKWVLLNNKMIDGYAAGKRIAG